MPTAEAGSRPYTQQGQSHGTKKHLGNLLQLENYIRHAAVRLWCSYQTVQLIYDAAYHVHAHNWPYSTTGYFPLTAYSLYQYELICRTAV